MALVAYRADTVPMSALKPIIKEWMRVNGYDNINPHSFGVQYFAGGIDVLANEAGVSRRRISAIMADTVYKDGCTEVSFDTADKLLCAMCRVEAWHYELKEWYGPIHVMAYEYDFEQPHVKNKCGTLAAHLEGCRCAPCRKAYFSHANKISNDKKRVAA